MPSRDVLEHLDCGFTFEQLTNKTLIFSVKRKPHPEIETFLNREACIALATKLLNAAQGLES